MKRIFRPILSIALCGALSGCDVTRISETAVLSADTPQCTADRYQPVVTRYMSILGPGVKRSIVNDALAGMATDVFLLEPLESGRCEVRYTTEHRSGAPIYDLPFSVRTTVSEEPTRLCLTHDDPIRRNQEERAELSLEESIARALRASYGDDNTASPVLPICFNRS
ncbi:hypothetical protein [Cognatiyoonia sp. IB215182]|uniref:hypothetical protein n=1 Tax=Cognatiyoonia sp. IB215182 TaxID=3097353 RepID=UPI002A15BBE9|nr:hypothetical protein [Cognatiyoonia sp. IB215182]MDX8355527.1 hypothetical protein [Cognatiyoonia sp. IB215182]